ncbi:MAG: hypothetical protein C0616_04100 [Desulfuromonas sp.]|nr:MAG: hypothetical protein C0616_04100 [Desulfuromonas sp.]
MPIKYLTHAVVAVTLLCAVASTATAADTTAQPMPLNMAIGSGIEYQSGDYGTGDTVTNWRVPLLLEWLPHRRFSLTAEIPYVHQSRTAETVLLGGTPTPTRQQRGSGRMSGGTNMGDSTTTVTEVETTDSEGGLGDITLDAALTLVEERTNWPRLNGLLYAKLPTADEEKGLGTGEFDWGAGFGLRKEFDKLSAYGELLWISPGSSDDYDPDSYLEWLASLSYRVGSVRPGISLSGGTAPFDDADDPLEVKLRLGGLAGDHGSYSLYLARGLSDGSPDWGVGLFGYLDF